MVIRPKARPEEEGLPAGFVSRLIALSIDLLLLTIVVTAVTVLGQFIGTSLGMGVWTLRLVALLTGAFGIALYILYFISLLVLGGQTIGKRVMGIRVLRTDGSRVRLKAAIKRFIGCIIGLPLFWGYLIVLIDNRRQAFHDKLGDTTVIYYTIPADELGPFEQHLRAIRLRREAKLAALKASMAEKATPQVAADAAQPPTD